MGIPAQDTVYTLPAATTSTLGGVKVGSGLVSEAGVVSVGDIDGGTF
ncbi:head fiber protein [Emergencia sp.]